MYIKEVKLKNIRCCEDLSLSFRGKEGSFLIIGDNGDGKSTVLRSIAMGLCDESSAAALHRDLPGELVRFGQDEAMITIILKSYSKRYYKIKTKIKALKTFEQVSQKTFRKAGAKWIKIPQEKFPWDKIFASAYGAGIRTQGTADYRSESVV